jgi:hypothetical protein
MFSLAIFYALIGAALSLRFTIMVLIPTMMLSAVIIFGVNVAWSTGLWTAAIDTVIAVTSVQIGYLAGMGARLFLGPSRPSAAATSRPHLAVLPREP